MKFLKYFVSYPGLRNSYARAIFASCLFINATFCSATIFVVSPNQEVVGEIQYDAPEIGETLDDVGRRFDLGHDEMVKANPKVDPHHSLSPVTKLVIPSQFKIPPVARKGIIINLANYRLYYFPEDDNVMYTYPVGIGRKGWNTPIGTTQVIAKVVNPVWHPTENIKREAAKNGLMLPDIFPAGEHNPLGKYALRLKWSSILIHGTNGSSTIGSRVSAGCIRLLPDDIEELFLLVSVATPVKVIDIVL